MNPVAFTIGSFEIKWYSIFILAAILICYFTWYYYFMDAYK